MEQWNPRESGWLSRGCNPGTLPKPRTMRWAGARCWRRNAPSPRRAREFIPIPGRWTMQRRVFLKASGIAAGALAVSDLGSPLSHAEETWKVAVTVHADQPLGDLKPIWRFF